MYAMSSQLLHLNEWIRLVNECHHLKKITLQIMENIQKNQQLTEDIVKVQKDLRNV